MSIDYEFAAVDVDLLVHPKAIAAGVEAMGLWLWGMAWAHKTGADGKLPRHVVLTAWGSGRQVVERLATRLVASGLWLKTADGWEIWNYAKKNQSAAEKARRREQGRERMRRLRARSRDARDGHGDASRDAHVHDQSDAPAIAPAPAVTDLGSRDRVVGPDGDSGVIFGAYVTGIREATGKPVTALTPSERATVVAIANAHAEGRTGEALETWIRETARDFAKQHDPTYGGFKPAQCAKWLDGGRKVRAGPNGRHHVQSSENRAWELPPEMK